MAEGGAASGIRPRRLVVMGVSGCGKSTLGRALAAALGWRFLEGDELHSPANVARMAAGIALTDADREAWLDAIGAELARAAARGEGLVAACSALKRSYRERLGAAEPALRFVHLHGARELLAARLAARRGHYMPASLLASQLATLEPPTADEPVLVLDIAEAPDEQLARARRHLEALDA